MVDVGVVADWGQSSDDEMTVYFMSAVEERRIGGGGCDVGGGRFEYESGSTMSSAGNSTARGFAGGGIEGRAASWRETAVCMISCPSQDW